MLSVLRGQLDCAIMIVAFQTAEPGYYGHVELGDLGPPPQRRRRSDDGADGALDPAWPLDYGSAWS